MYHTHSRVFSANLVALHPRYCSCMLTALALPGPQLRKIQDGTIASQSVSQSVSPAPKSIISS